jgi:hypothetical protein
MAALTSKGWSLPLQDVIQTTWSQRHKILLIPLMVEQNKLERFYWKAF